MSITVNSVASKAVLKHFMSSKILPIKRTVTDVIKQKDCYTVLHCLHVDLLTRLFVSLL